MRRTIVVVALLLLAALFLLLRGCEEKDEPRAVREDALFVPAELADRLGLSVPDGVIEYCRNLPSASYEGVFRGGHGALWAQECNDWDRYLLTKEALAPHGIAYDDAPADEEPSRAVLRVSLLLDGRAADTFELEIQKLVHAPVLLRCRREDGGLAYQLLVDGIRRGEVSSLKNVKRADLVLRWRNRAWTRELFDAVNAAPEIPGHDRPREGDVYALVVAAGPIVEEVLETREKMLAGHPQQDLILMGAKYFVDSDMRTRRLARQVDVEVSYASPRIVVAASEVLEKPFKDRTQVESLDVLANRIEAKGVRARQLHLARGLANDLIEARILFERTQMKVINASTILSHHKARDARSPQRRIKRLTAELVRILSEEPVGTRLKASTLVAEYTAQGFTLHGVGFSQDIRKGTVSDRYRLKEGAAVPFGRDAKALAVVADGLLAVQAGDAGYELHMELERALATDPLPVAAGSVLYYEALFEGKKYNVTVPLFLREGVAGGRWLATPVDQQWMTANADVTGPVAGVWPEVLGKTLKGPSVESVLMTNVVEDGDVKNPAVQIGAVKHKIPTVRVDLKRQALIEVLSGANWCAAEFVRDAGFLRRARGDYFVRLLPQGDVLRVPRNKWRRLDAMELDGKWVNVLQRRDGKALVHHCSQSDEASEWVAVDKLSAVELPQRGPGALAFVSKDGRFPVVVGWQEHGSWLRLRKASPVLVGRVIDAETQLPVAGADVARGDGSWRVTTAADGSFALPLDDPLFPLWSEVTEVVKPYLHPGSRKPKRLKLLFIVDGSARMGRGLDAEKTDTVAQGRNRMDFVSRVVPYLKKKLVSGKDTVFMDLWLAADGKVEAKLEGSRSAAELGAAIKAHKPSGEPAVAAALHRLRKAGLHGTIVFLITGGGSAGLAAPPHPLHICGIGVKSGSEEDAWLRDLAVSCAGSFRATEEAPPYTLRFSSLTARAGALPVVVSHHCYGASNELVRYDAVASGPITFGLTHACSCAKDKSHGLLTIDAKNVADLSKCEGLSAKARAMIEERVNGGKWRVTIPRVRTNIGGVTVYGWFETEIESGRLVGRIEDGLHGAVAGPHGWPPFKAIAGKQPFVAWYHGLVAYTSGSVKGMFDWRNSPGFLSGDAEDLKRFVQANALEFAAGWWEEVGSKAFDEMADQYWAGVCLNFELQSAALGLKSDACMRRWAENLCNRVVAAVTAAPGQQLDSTLTELFGAEEAALVQAATRQGYTDMVTRIEKWWAEGVKEGFDCKQYRTAGGKK